MIDAKKTALVERLRLVPRGRGKGVACLLPHSGVKVARTFRDDQQGPRELKKYRLNTKQVRSTKGLGVFPQAQPVTVFFLYGFYRVRALPWGSESLPRPSCQAEVKQLPAPSCQPSVLTSGD